MNITDFFFQILGKNGKSCKKFQKHSKFKKK